MSACSLAACPLLPRVSVALSRRIAAPLGVHSGSVPLDLFAGAASALLGKDRKPVRLQPVRRGRSFLASSFVGFMSEVSFAVLFLLLLFLLSVLLFEWFFLVLVFLAVFPPATVWVGV